MYDDNSTKNSAYGLSTIAYDYKLNDDFIKKANDVDKLVFSLLNSPSIPSDSSEDIENWFLEEIKGTILDDHDEFETVVYDILNAAFHSDEFNTGVYIYKPVVGRSWSFSDSNNYIFDLSKLWFGSDVVTKMNNTHYRQKQWKVMELIMDRLLDNISIVSLYKTFFKQLTNQYTYYLVVYSLPYVADREYSYIARTDGLLKGDKKSTYVDVTYNTNNISIKALKELAKDDGELNLEIILDVIQNIVFDEDFHGNQYRTLIYTLTGMLCMLDSDFNEDDILEVYGELNNIYCLYKTPSEISNMIMNKLYIMNTLTELKPIYTLNPHENDMITKVDDMFLNFISSEYVKLPLKTFVDSIDKIDGKDNRVNFCTNLITFSTNIDKFRRRYLVEVMMDI